MTASSWGGHDDEWWRHMTDSMFSDMDNNDNAGANDIHTQLLHSVEDIEQVYHSYDINDDHTVSQQEWDAAQSARAQKTETVQRLAYAQLTDAGNVERFLKEFGKDILFVTNTGKGSRAAGGDASGAWYLWKGTHWVVDTRNEIMHLARSVLLIVWNELEERRERLTQRQIREYEAHQRYSSSLRGIRNLVHLASMDPRVSCDGSIMDGARNKLGLVDGTCIELHETGKVSIRATRRDDYISMVSPAEFDRTGDILRNPPAEVVEYLDSFIPDMSVRQRLQRVFGKALLGANPDRVMPIIIGESTSGKSQLTEAIEKALGDYACVAAPSILRGNLDEKPRPDIVHVIQRRIIFLNEAANTWQLHGDKIKDMTGGSSFPVRSLHANTFVTLEPFFTPFIVTNSMPRITGVAEKGFRRRLTVFEFNESFIGKEDTRIKQRFVHSPAVWKWLLAWMVQGYALAYREAAAGIVDEKSVAADTERTDRAFRSLTHTGEFLEWLRDDDRLVEMTAEEAADAGCTHSQYVQMRDFYKIYRAWVIEYGDVEIRREQLKFVAFNKELQRVFGWEKHKCNSSTHWLYRRLEANYSHIDTLLLSWFREKTVNQIKD